MSEQTASSRPKFTDVSNGPGASDGNNGGGAGAGIPDAETTIRTNGLGTHGDTEQDRAKLFPDAPKPHGGRDA